MYRGPQRKSPRLRGFDYASNAAFFVTVCTYGRQHLFGEIMNGEMVLNEAGNIVYWEWYRSEEIRREVTLDAFVIMPNHIHGIVIIQQPAANPIAEDVGTSDRSSLRGRQYGSAAGGTGKRTLSAMMAGFKSSATTRINQLRQTPGIAVWQDRYHDRIIRGERELQAIRTYIECNPANWAADEENL